MSNAARALIALLAVAAAGVLFLVLSDGEEADPGPSTSGAATTTEAGGDKPQEPKPEKPEKPKPKPEPEVATIVVKGGQPVGGVQELSFDEGDAIRFVVQSDVADHVHLHGYDVMQDVAAGGSTEFNVPATLTGVFEAELEDSVVPIAEISVEPG
jgi:hypothetical protein